MKKVKLWQNLQEQKKNKEGAALVTVLMAMGILSILVVVVLFASSVNYKMKIASLKAKDNFYSAEGAVEEIRVGLQSNVSDAFAKAYVVTMEEYSEATAEIRTKKFQSAYEAELIKELIDENNGSGVRYYKTQILESYLKKTAYNMEKKTGAVIVKLKDQVLNVDSDGVTLKNVDVRFTDADAYTSEIKTDIVLQYPELDFSQSGSMPNLLEYTLIAGSSIQAFGRLNVALAGSVYGGKNGVQLTNSSVSMGHSLNRSKNTFVTDANIHLMDSNFILRGMDVWANGLEVNNSALNLTGKAYISNDLELSGGNRGSSQVTINGEYYGYGNPEALKIAASSQPSDLKDAADHAAAYNSAMIVNSVHSELNLQKLNKFLLAGNSYVAVQQEKESNGKDILTGESVSIKPGQLAYLVPAKYIGQGEIIANPMPASQYEELIQQYGSDHLVDMEQVKGEYPGIQFSQKGYQMAAYPITVSGQSFSMIYLFWDFEDQKSANAYNKHYYVQKEHQESLNQFADGYDYQIQLPYNQGIPIANANFYYNGNVLVNGETQSFFLPDMLTDRTSELARELVGKEAAFYDTFAGLKCKLMKEYYRLTPSDLSAGGVYENLVSFPKGPGKVPYIAPGSYETFVTKDGGEYGTIVINGDAVINRINVNAWFGSPNVKLRAVIASGDVVVEDDFSGMLIAGGNITIGASNIKIKANPESAALALKAENASGNCGLNYLKNAEEYVTGTGNADLSTGSVSLSKLIHYKNWEKK